MVYDKRMKKFIFALFFTALTLCGFTQDFQNLSVDDGLSNHMVYSVQQYNKGMMWFSTKLGIDRFDGSSFKHYNLYPSDKLMQVGHRQSHLQTDNFGRLWVSNNFDIFLYNKDQDAFDVLYSDENSIIRDIFIADANTLFVATNKGLIRYRIDSKKTTHYSALTNVITNIAPYDHRLILLIEKNKIWAFDYKQGKILRNILRPEFSEALNGKSITALSVDSAQNIYAGVSGKIIAFNLTDNKFITSPELNKRFNNCEVKKIIPHQNLLYVGTEGAGFYKINSKLEVLKSYTSDRNKPSSLRGNSIYDIFIDNDHRVWAAGEGVNYYDPNKLRFKVFQHQTNNPNSLIHNYVRAVTEDTNGNLWVGTKYGISIFNRQQQTWKHINQETSNNVLAPGDILSLAKDHNQNIIAGTYKSGIYYIDKNYNVKKSARNQSSSIYSLLAGGDHLWLGSSREALRVDSDNQSRSFPIPYVLSITKNRNGDIITGGHNGLNIINRAGQISKYDPMKYKIGSIFCVKVDKKGRVWCASEGQGLIRFLEKEKSFKKYTMRDGLPSDIVYGILEDKRGNLWLSTTNGLSRFNPEREEFTNYTIGDGLTIKEFNYGAAAETANGELIFGGINGFVIFKPEDIENVNVKTHLVFTDFKIFNVSGKVGGDGSPLMRVIDQTDTISLKHDENSLTFNFTSINYTNIAKTLYTWKLEGLDKTWSPPGKGHTAVYTNLKPGKYTFRVKSTNNPSVFSNAERTIFIQISPPFWETYLAYFVYLILILTIIHFIVRYYHIRISEDHAKDKINFFTNIAHDIRTPLSLIRSPLSLALKRNDVSAETRKSLKTADQNAERLSLLINQLLEFEKADQKKNELRLIPINIDQTINELCTNFSPYLDERGITLITDFKKNNITAYLDRDKFEKIIFNLLSNAIKYTPRGGQVKIITDILANKYLIQISDTGVGIPKDQQKHIFKRYFRAQNALNSNETGSGIGLMLTKKLIELHKGSISFESTVDKGSTFRVLLLLTHNPAIKPEAEHSKQDPTYPEPSKRRAIQINGKKPALLIAEDHRDLRDHLVENLSDFYTIYQAENGKEALKLTKSIFPDIIISDVMMPEMNGNEFCYQIKNNIDTSHIPFILLTSLTATYNKIDGIKTGADIYLEKPFDLELLKSYIDNLLQNQKRLKEKFLKSEMSANDDLSTLDKEFVSNGIRIIEENLSNSDFSVEDFEKAMGMSHAALYRKFKTLIGKTPLEFINQYRLKKAAELLKQGCYNVNEVAYMVGFSDPKYFSTSFKKLFGNNASNFKEKPNTVIKNL